MGRAVASHVSWSDQGEETATFRPQGLSKRVASAGPKAGRRPWLLSTPLDRRHSHDSPPRLPRQPAAGTPVPAPNSLLRRLPLWGPPPWTATLSSFAARPNSRP